MLVKNWKPNAGCEECEQAKKLFESHARIAEATTNQAVKKIKDLTDKLDEAGFQNAIEAAYLKGYNKGFEAGVKNASDLILGKGDKNPKGIL